LTPAYKLSRRKFIQAALAAAAATGAGVGCVSSGSPWRFLSVKEARTLAAACDQVVPADEAPGAAWAGVVNFIDRQLCGHLQDLRQLYRDGIAAMNATSRILCGSDFAWLAAETQFDLLQKIEWGQVPAQAWHKVAPAEFFPCS
jgi:hypothetical protein